MTNSDTAPASTGGPDPDGDPDMKTSGTTQPDQAEGDDDPAQTGEDR